MRGRTIWLGLLACALSAGSSTASTAAELTWWSHWATQDNKKVVLEEVRKRFEVAHPGTKVTLTYWELANMYPALRLVRSRKDDSGALLGLERLLPRVVLGLGHDVDAHGLAPRLEETVHRRTASGGARTRAD